MKKFIFMFLVLCSFFPTTGVLGAEPVILPPSGIPSRTESSEFPLTNPSAPPTRTRCDTIRAYSSAYGNSSIQQLIGSTGCLIGSAVKVTIPLALIFFLYGLMRFILNAGNEEAQKQGKNIMIWGTIALFVMVSVWGLVTLLQGEFGVESFNF